jgi:hypothetical protein
MTVTLTVTESSMNSILTRATIRMKRLAAATTMGVVTMAVEAASSPLGLVHYCGLSFDMALQYRSSNPDLHSETIKKVLTSIFRERAELEVASIFPYAYI